MIENSYRGWNPDVTTLVQDENMDLLEARDAEIWNSYQSVFQNADSTITEHLDAESITFLCETLREMLCAHAS